ncbi:MAG: hypothetical protein GEV04_18585 [Actinophytocola sp.]|nr:hypothetical protein [Actinophytocola sp.]
MSGGFKIDIDQVGGLVTTLENAGDRMTRANNALKDLAPSDMGSEEIDESAGEFQDRWEHGIEKIIEFSTSLTDGLKQARKLYVEMDSGAASSLNQMSSELSGGGGQQSGDSEISCRLEGRA